MAKYESIADITQERADRVERARRYDTLRTTWSDNARKVERLEAKNPGPSPATRLERIIEEANKLPGDLVGTIGGLQPVEGIARGFLVALASSALANWRRIDDQRLAAIADAKKKRDDAKRALDEEFPE